MSVCKNKIYIAFGFLLCLIPIRLSAQESIRSSYERNFIRAGLQEKTGILIDAAKDEKSAEFIGGLYEFALQFALFNGGYMKDDADMIALVSTAAKGAGGAGNTASVTSLLALFEIYSDSYSLTEILGALAVLGKGNAEVSARLNSFLETQNASFRAGVSPDFPSLRACVTALGVLGDRSSFSALFSAMTASYPQAVTQEILKALDSLQGNYKEELLTIIKNNPFQEKAAAFRLGAYNEKLTPGERAELAEAALETALDSSVPSAAQDTAAPAIAASLRYDAVPVLTRLKWSAAAPLVIRNFYQVQADYTSGTASKERFLEAIACLGVMRTTEAAQALALQLGYFNSQTERSGEFDEPVILALVGALGELGDKAAFDCLLYISYLNYPDKIQTSAREALNRLKW